MTRDFEALEKKAKLFRVGHYFCGECEKEIKLGYSCVVFTVFKKKHRIVDFKGKLALSQTSNFLKNQILLCKGCDESD